MSDDLRIDVLRRRMARDPNSIAFAQLAEEYRRAGRYREAIATCRDGLARHPAYVSARVTLGRALVAIGDLEAAERELEQVLLVAGDNLAALKGLGDVHRQRGHLPEALAQYRTALDLAPQDPEVEQVIAQIEDEIRRPRRPTPPPRVTSLPGASPPRAVATEPPPGPTRVLPPEIQLLPILERWLDAILADRQRRALSGRKPPR